MNNISQEISYVSRLYKKVSEKLYDSIIEKVIDIVCAHEGISINVINLNTRKREIVQARQISHYLLKSMSGLPLSVIGWEVGKKDHSTVLHSCKTISGYLDVDKEWRKKINEIEKKLI